MAYSNGLCFLPVCQAANHFTTDYDKNINNNTKNVYLNKIIF
jgi:hypothetical protein